MKHTKIVLLFIVLIVLAVAPAAAQDGGGADNPLLDMLALVPADAAPTDAVPIFGYADYRALEAARGLENPGTFEAFDADEEGVAGYWRNALFRLSSGPRLDYLFAQVIDMPRLVGFEWFDVNRGLTFGIPPAEGTIFAGEFDTGNMGEALSARDFEQVDYEGVAIWRRFEDGSVSIEDREPGDPFGGALGRAARIAVIPGNDDMIYLANSAADIGTQMMVDAAQGNVASLADDPDYRALAEAVTDSNYYGGVLIQASVFHVFRVGFVPDEPVMAGGDEDAPDPMADYGELPVYSLAMLADRQEGDEEVHIVALVYADADTAQIAAEELAARLGTFARHDDPTFILVDYYGSQIETHVYENEEIGRAVAVVEVRQVGPELGETGDSGMLIAPGRMFSIWNGLMARWQFYPIRIVEEQ